MQWMGGACELTELRAALLAKMDDKNKAALAENCSSALPERWLAGTWHAEQTTLVIEKKGDGYVWNFDRKSGQMSKTWGEKETATATGSVSTIKGCQIELKGAYTAFGGAGQKGRNPVGWPMSYTLDLIAPAHLAGTGLGYGQKPYRMIFSRK
jgi:hypothetical protein